VVEAFVGSQFGLEKRFYPFLGILGYFRGFGVIFTIFKKCQIYLKNAKNLLKMASFHVFLEGFWRAKPAGATFVGRFG
jgi:hypothetical protein